METQKLITRIGKMLSGAHKPGEGFATIFAYEPKDYLEKQHGNLYFVIEVGAGSESAPTVSEAVINSIKQEFYSDLNRSVILSLESALRKANEELSDLTSSGETDWIGKLNVACVIVGEGKLHLSKVGSIEAYIIRGEKVTHISEGLSVEEEEKDKHPLKTFSTITSGALQKDDKLMVSSSELFYHISLAGLKKLVKENTPSQAIQKLRELLKDEEEISQLCFLTIEMTTEEELSKQHNRHEVDEVWIGEQKPSETAMGFLSSLGSGALNLSKKALSNIKGKVTPGPKEGNIPGVDKKPSDIEIPGRETEELPKEDQKEEIKKTEPLTSHPAGDRPQAERNQNQDTKAKNKESFLEFTKNYFKDFSFKKFTADVKKVFTGFFKDIKKKSHSAYFKLFIVVAVLFVISVGVLLNNYYSDKKVKEFKTKLDKAISLEAQAENALIYEARPQAKEYLDESKLLAEEVLKSKYYQKEAMDLLAKIESFSKKADGITEVTPELVLETSNIANFTYLDKNIYFLNSQNNQLIVYNTDKKQQEPQEISATKSNFSQIAPYPGKKLIMLYNDALEIFEFSAKTSKASQAINKKGFKKATALTTYSSYFYILSAEENQIFRYSKGTSEYTGPTNYITDKTVDIKDARSFTIPGIVYILKADGQVVKLIKGVKQEFSFKEMPFEFKNPIKIQSNDGSNEIYVLDKELGVLVFSVNGKYIKNITSSEFKDLKDFYVDEASGNIYVLAGNKILSLKK